MGLLIGGGELHRRGRRRNRRRWVQALGAIRQGNGGAYWPASQSNMAAGVSAGQSVMVLERKGKANRGHLLLLQRVL